MTPFTHIQSHLLSLERAATPAAAGRGQSWTAFWHCRHTGSARGAMAPVAAPTHSYWEMISVMMGRKAEDVQTTV